MGNNGTRNIAVLLDSLQQHCFNRRIADELVEMAPRPMRLEIVDISRLGLYRPELVASPPPEWVLFRQQILAADGVLFVTNKNNRTVPGVLRNALEIAAHPDDRNAWAGKPGGIVSVSAEGIMRSSAERHLRQALLSRDVPVMDLPPDHHLARTPLFGTTSLRLTNEEIHLFLEQFVEMFHGWVRTGYLH